MFDLTSIITRLPRVFSVASASLSKPLAQVVAATETDCTLKEFWKNYSILNVIQNVTAAWDKVMKENMNGIWKMVLKA